MTHFSTLFQITLDVVKNKITVVCNLHLIFVLELTELYVVTDIQLLYFSGGDMLYDIFYKRI